MCGIVAQINAEDVFDKETLRHRGPDEISNFNFNKQIKLRFITN